MDLIEKRRELQKLIDVYVERYIGGHKQGSPEWLEARKGTIGGSEMATIQGINTFSSIPKLLAGKLKMEPRERSIKMQWGKLFEDMICTFIEHDKQTKITGQDIFIIGRKPNQSYSPDGIGIIDVNRECVIERDITDPSDKDCIEKRVVENRHINGPAIALFEFKCPFNRLLQAKCPNYYECQVLAGLDTIPITQIGCYAEAIFRICHYTDYNWGSEYKREWWPKDLKNKIYLPLARGYVIWCIVPNRREAANNSPVWQKLKEYMREYDMCMAVDDQFTDIADFDFEHYEMLMDLYEDKIIQPWISPMLFRDEPSSEQKWGVKVEEMLPQMQSKDWDIVCVQTYKLLRCDYTFIDKQVGYIEKWQPTIDKITGVMKECSDDPENKQEIYDNFCKNYKPRAVSNYKPKVDSISSTPVSAAFIAQLQKNK